MSDVTRLGRGMALLLLTLALVGCVSQRGTHRSSSVVSYLYPNGDVPAPSEAVPVLRLPLRVGIAMVAGSEEGTDRSAMAPQLFTEKDRVELMQRVRDQFDTQGYVKSIEIIPSAYLTERGGFTNLDQLRSMFGIDVIALLSYDQTQFTDEGRTSLTYLTLLGAYVVEGEKNDTRTMMDAAVLHIPSRRMLFRAPGVSHIKGSATPVNLTEELRRDAQQGMQQAADDMIRNLQQQLEEFKARVKDAPDEYRIETAPGYTPRGATGGGSVDLTLLGLLAALGAGAAWAHRRERRRAQGA